MPTPTVDANTPGAATVYIANHADGSVGTCTVDQWRGLYSHREGLTLTTRDAFVEHERALTKERSWISTRTDLVATPDGKTAVEVATSRRPTPPAES